MDAERLFPLISRIPLLSTPVRAHEAEDDIEASLNAWALRGQLVSAGPAYDRFQAHRFGFLASHTFPDAKADDVVLWAQWLAWLVVLEDSHEDGKSDVGKRTLSGVLAGRRDRKGLSPIDKALRELWTATAPRSGPAWRRRFVGKLDLHQAACANEAANRRRGRLLSPSEYVVLRRGTFGAYLFDLIEAVLRTEVPARMLATSTWRTLYEGSIDVSAWFADIASFAPDQAAEDTHNMVYVAAKAFGMPPTAAIDWVGERIIERCAQMRAAVLTLPGLFDRCGYDRPTATYLSRVACALLTLPRAYFEWLLTSARYTERDPSVTIPRQANADTTTLRRAGAGHEATAGRAVATRR